MKKNFKSLLIVSLLIIVVGLFSACTKKELKSEDNFSKILERGYVVVGLDDTFAPMGFRDVNGEIVGFDVDLASETFKKIGLDVEFQPIDWSMKETELNSGNIDMIWNGYTITEERKKKVEFTKPYLENRQVIITLINSKITSKEDLKGKNIGVQNGSSSYDAVSKDEEFTQIFDNGELVLFETNNEAFMDLETGRIDAIVADEILARYYINQRDKNRYKILDDDFGNEEYGVGLRKEDKELLNRLQEALNKMKVDGTSAAISNKWFGQDIVK